MRCGWSPAIAGHARRETRIDLRPNRRGVARAGGTVWYDHELQNFSDRDFDPANADQRIFFTTDALNAANGWTYLLYRWDGQDETTAVQLPFQSGGAHDGKQYLDQTLKAAGDAGNNDRKYLRVKLFVPINTPDATHDVLTITAASDQTNDPKATDEIVDVTVIVNSDLMLTKTASIGAANPGDTITYTTAFRSLGTAALTDVVITDAIPEHTSFVRGSMGATTPTGVTLVSEYSTDWGVGPWAADSGTGTLPTVTNVRWRLTTSLPAGAEGSVTFQVQVD